MNNYGTMNVQKKLTQFDLICKLDGIHIEFFDLSESNCKLLDELVCSFDLVTTNQITML